MLIAFDFETGGLTADTSLLEVYFGIFDDDFDLVDELQAYVIPDNGKIVVTPGALRVNKLDLSTFSEATPYKDFKTTFYQFLEKNKPEGDKLIPLGHNLKFDLQFLHEYVMTKKTWNIFTSYRILDTAGICQFLKQAGILEGPSGSLQSLVDHFEVEFDGKHHEARADTLATVEVYKAMLRLVQLRDAALVPYRPKPWWRRAADFLGA